MKKTALQWFIEQLEFDESMSKETIEPIINKALEIEKKQLFLAANQSAKEAYKAGQETMECGCYAISDAQTYEDWLYSKYKSDDTESE
jgi:hypothetical protein